MSKQMCPGCKSPLIVFELNGVEIDHCPACGGTWLDAGELEQIAFLAGAGTERLAAALRAARTGERSKRRCPRCNRRMRLLGVGQAEPVELDACPAGHGLWFDRGELRKVIERCGEGSIGTVGQFFCDLFRSEMEK